MDSMNVEISFPCFLHTVTVFPSLSGSRSTLGLINEEIGSEVVQAA